VTHSTHATEATQAHRRAVIWIDHLTAKIFGMGLTGISSSIVHAHLSSSHLHHQANAIGSGRVAQDPAFLVTVARVVQTCDNILIIGPGTEKTSLMHYLQSARPKIALHLGPIDHPTDEEIIATGRKHFGLSEPRA
jgi:stalled ribosome rescue protein Dom34